MPVGCFFISDEEEDENVENEGDEDVGRKSAEEISAADDVSAAGDADLSDAASPAPSPADMASQADDEHDEMSAGDEDEDVDVEAAESDKISVEAKEQMTDQKVSDMDDRLADR